MFYVPCDVNISVLVSVQLLLLFQQRNDAVINFHYVLIKRWDVTSRVLNDQANTL